MINNIVMIILLSVIVEYIVNVLKPLMPETSYPVPLVLSMVIGICLGLLVKVDILSAVGFEPVNLTVSYVITGLIASGGSTAVHELISKLRASRTDIKA
ncbi:MAG: hypothetical protein ACOX3H_06895 [Saccharofermentanales bacterium]